MTFATRSVNELMATVTEFAGQKPMAFFGGPVPADWSSQASHLIVSGRRNFHICGFERVRRSGGRSRLATRHAPVDRNERKTFFGWDRRRAAFRRSSDSVSLDLLSPVRGRSLVDLVGISAKPLLFWRRSHYFAIAGILAFVGIERLKSWKA